MVKVVYARVKTLGVCCSRLQQTALFGGNSLTNTTRAFAHSFPYVRRLKKKFIFCMHSFGDMKKKQYLCNVIKENIIQIMIQHFENQCKSNIYFLNFKIMKQSKLVLNEKNVIIMLGDKYNEFYLEVDDKLIPTGHKVCDYHTYLWLKDKKFKENTARAILLQYIHLIK